MDNLFLCQLGLHKWGPWWKSFTGFFLRKCERCGLVIVEQR